MWSVSKFIKVTFLKRTAVGKVTVGKIRIISKYEFKGKNTQKAWKAFQTHYKWKSCKKSFSNQPRFVKIGISSGSELMRKVVLRSAQADSPVNFIWFVLIFKTFEPAPSSIKCNEKRWYPSLIFAGVSKVLSLWQVTAGMRARSGRVFCSYIVHRTSYIEEVELRSFLFSCLADRRRKDPLPFFAHRREVVMQGAIVSLRIYIVPSFLSSSKGNWKVKAEVADSWPS